VDAREIDEIEGSVARFADMLAAMGAESRLQIMRLLLGAHPDGLVVGEIMDRVSGSPSTLSHHLDKLRVERLVTVQRQGKYLRYRANAPALRELLAFFWSECCTRNSVIDPCEVMSRCTPECRAGTDGADGTQAVAGADVTAGRGEDGGLRPARRAGGAAPAAVASDSVPDGRRSANTT